MSTQPKPFITPQQYLEIERSAEYKSEYFEGELFAMSGGTLDHSRIQRNLIRIIDTQLVGHSCEPAGSDLRIQISPDGPYFYPDVVVFCGEPKFADSSSDCLTDATVVIEVLSPSSEVYDRSYKFQNYTKLPALTDYLLIAQNRIYVEHRKRQSNGRWLTDFTTDSNAYITLRSIECGIKVGEIYSRVLNTT